MRIVFLGSGAFAQPTMRWLAQSGHETPLAITQPARGSGRGRHVTRTPARMMAEELGWECIEAENCNDAVFVNQIKSLNADIGLVIAFGQKLGAEFRSAFRGGCINLHASLLPKFRGAAPINWAILKGEERTGCTVFRLVDRMDAGPILTSRWTLIKPDETAGELHDRLAAIGVDAVKAAVELFADGRIPEGAPQDESEATPAPKLQKTDGYLFFTRTAQSLAGHIHGVTPWPGAQARFEAAGGRWENVSLIRARPAELPTPLVDPPGVLDSRLFVAAADGYVELLEIKPSSGRVMHWSEYVNGRHVRKGDRFVSPSSADASPRD